MTPQQRRQHRIVMRNLRERQTATKPKEYTLPLVSMAEKLRAVPIRVS